MSFVDYFDNADWGLQSLKRPYPFEAEEHVYATPTTGTAYTDDALGLNTNDTACFGSIDQVKVQLYNIDQLNRWGPSPGGSMQSFDIVREGNFMVLEHGGTRFGRLDKGLCRLLPEIITKKQVFIRAYVPTNDWRKVIIAQSHETPGHLFVEVSIYGVQEVAKEIGGILSKSRIFLQMPRHELEGVKYYNPHLLRIEGYPESVYSEVVPFEQHDISTDGPFDTPEGSGKGAAQPNDTTMVDKILDSLSHHTVLREINIVPDIRTELLPHQKEAVDFIFQRETEQISSDLSLWKYNDTDADEPFYQHKFSGAKRPEPAEARGGMIADEMGLGKTLVILSTIAGSFDRSRDFASVENQQLSSQPLKKRASAGTLILAPSSLLIDNWVDEIRKYSVLTDMTPLQPRLMIEGRHTHPGTLPFHKHLGPQRHNETQLLYERSIVLTTYATVAAESRRDDNTLAKVHWFRIVLDEAHDIRNRSTKQFQSVASIPALHRWCLTGTPIQNSLEDLGALVSFLRVPILEKSPSFRKFIINPIHSNSRSRFQNLQVLLETICLRRTRQLLDLPEPVAEVRELIFTSTEKSEYHDLLKKGKMYIDMAVSKRGKSTVNVAFLKSLLKLRLFCNNGHARDPLQPSSNESLWNPDEALGYLEQENQNYCAYCSGIIYYMNESAGSEGGSFTSCRYHVVCHSCLVQHRARNQSCPICSASGESASSVPLPSRGIYTDPDGYDNIYNSMWPVGQYPSKLWALVSDIHQSATHKSIVFSGWKKTLHLAGELLRHQGIRYNIIDGSLSLAERIKLIGDFKSHNGANVLLMTLGTGAVGLNLAIATRIYLLEPQWNPSIESQAIGRALRLGQTAPVVITRYIMKDSIEQNNVIFRQKKKLELAGRGFKKRKENSLERLQALRDVFSVDTDLA